MAKIKTTFIKGRMNKDLDERLMPKGEYRDARNIEVSTSEGSNVGTVQNILGNTIVDSVLDGNFICVGSIADEGQNKAYWFASSEDKDVIVEYDPALEVSSLVFVDINKRNTKACLKFDQKIITGINIIDNFLFFTDGYNEPKKINIKRSKIGTTDLNTHTKLIVSEKHVYSDNRGDVREENITVIKKRPTRPLRVKVNKSNTNKEKGIFEKIFPRFSYRYRYADGEVSAYGPFTKPIFSANFTDNLNSLNFFNLKNGYNTSMVNTIESIDLLDIIGMDAPRDIVSVDILFKRDDSNVVYVVENVDVMKLVSYSEFNLLRGKYTITTENIFSAIEENQNLRVFDSVPKTALAQEVTGNRIVYGNYTQGFDVGDVEVNSNYFVKDFTNQSFSQGGIESIKAQRDYQIGVVFGDYYGRETQVFTSNEGSVTVPWSDSSKTQGPSYLEPLMLTSSLSTNFPSWASYYKFYVKETSGEYYNLLMDAVYVPSLSTDYENEEDHVYLSFPSSEINKIQEDSYIILKKTSSSVEKPVKQLNRYKVIDIFPEAPDAVAFMYLSTGEISNLSNNDNLSNISNEDIGLFTSQTNRIDNVTDILEISATEWISGGNSPLPGMEVSDENFTSELDASDYYVSWKRVSATGKETHSRRYRVVNVSQGSTTKIKLQEKISIEDAKLAYDNLGTDVDETDDTTTNPIPDYANGATSSADKLHPDLVFSIKRKVKKDGEDFSGKFFVKVLADEILKENLINFSSKNTSEFISSSNDTFWWGDVANADGNEDLGINTIYGNTPNTQPGSADDPTNTVTEWDLLLTDHGKAMFIDNMSMVSSNLSSSNYAKHSGQGVKANEVIYSKNEWDYENETSWSSSNEYSIETMSAVIDSSIEQEDWINNIVNSMHGILQINSSYIEGSNAWKEDIYSQELDSVYGEDENAFFMHISFFAPGKDLHDGSDFGDSDAPLDEVETRGENSIASLLKGIWGGGAFQYDEDKFVEFEGNYLDGDALAEAPGPNVGSGYDINFKELHERQWEPTFSPNSSSFNSDTEIDEDLENFIQNIKIGKKFKFENDDNNEIYTILDVSVKHIYNHTPWRSRYINHSANGISRAGDSVEEAAILWAKAKEIGTDQVVSAETNDVSPAQNLVNKIEAFGKASNRRTCYIVKLDKNPALAENNLIDGTADGIDLDTSTKIQFIDTEAQAQSGLVKNISAIFETEPKDSLDLNIFYEASQAIPTYLNFFNAPGFAPQGCRVEFVNLPQATKGQHIVTENIILANWEQTEDGDLYFTVINENALEDYSFQPPVFTGIEGEENEVQLDYTLININNYIQSIEAGTENNFVFNSLNSSGVSIQYSEAIVRFYREDGSYTSCTISTNNDLINHGIENHNNRYAFVVNKNVNPNLSVGLNWFNCFSFGNGVESNRIRDDFNAPFISNGARASTTLDESYQDEEQRKYGLIYSGVYNAPSGVNNLNQFIAAEKITKDLNPTYGSIQKLFSRRSDLIAFCEDRVVKILANKDALFNADGNVNLVATENVLGQASPFVGEYGISQNPESFAKESYRAYFTDKNRGTVLRLSMDGLTPISEAGMHDYFRDELPKYGTLLGTYDDYKKQYNLSFGLARYNNILFNSYISEGETLNQSISTSQIILNGDLNASEEVQLVDPQFLYENNAIISNEFMQEQITIVNWPEILAGSIGAYYNATVTVPAAFQYDLVSQNYGISYYLDGDGNNIGQATTYVTTATTVEVTPGVFPKHGGASDDDSSSPHGGYIHRSVGDSTGGGYTQDPFAADNYGSGNSQCKYFNGVKYGRFGGGTYVQYIDPAAYSLNGETANNPDSDKGILVMNDTSTEMKRNFIFPFQKYNESNQLEINEQTQHAFGSEDQYFSSAQDSLSFGGTMNPTHVMNAEVIVVKVRYRVVRKWQFDASNNPQFDVGKVPMKITLMDGSTDLVYGGVVVSNIENTVAGSSGALIAGNTYMDPDSYQNTIINNVASSDNPFVGVSTTLSDGTNNVNGSSQIPPATYSYESVGYTAVEEGVSSLADLNNQFICFHNHSSSSCSIEFDTNPYGYTPANNLYNSTNNNSTFWPTINDTEGLHAPFYSQLRTAIVQFRVFDKNDPFTSKRIINNLNVNLSFGVTKVDNAFVESVALWRQFPLEEIGTPYSTQEVTINVDAPATPVYDFLDVPTTETYSGADALALYNAGLVADQASLLPVNMGDPWEGTVITVSNEQYTPQQVVGDEPVPAETIPAFAEVINISTPGFTFTHLDVPRINPSPLWNSFANSDLGDDLVGVSPQGEWVEVTITDANGNDQTVKYRQQTEAGSGNFLYNTYVGDAIDSFDGEALGSHYQGSNTAPTQATFDGPNGGIYFGINQPEPSDVRIKIENEDGSDLFVAGNYYVVDLFYNEEAHPDSQITAPALSTSAKLNGRRVRLDGVVDAGIAAQCHLETQSLQVEDSAYPAGHFGQIHYIANNDADLIPLPVTVTEYGSPRKALRGIFKATENSNQYVANGNNFSRLQIRGYGAGNGIENYIHFTGVQIIDITQTDAPGGFSEYWHTNTFQQPEHAFEDLSAYYAYGGWNFNIPSTQTIPDLFQNYLEYSFENNEFSSLSSDEVVYILETNVLPNGDTGVFNGIVRINVTTPVQEDGLVKGIRIDYTVGSVGKMKIAFTNNGEFEVIEPFAIDSGASVDVFATGEAQNNLNPTTINSPGGGVKVVMVNFGEFNAQSKIESIKLYIESTVISGGNIGSWLFSSVQPVGDFASQTLSPYNAQVNPANINPQPPEFTGPQIPITSESYIYFENEGESNDQYIKLDNAPGGTQIYQFLENPLQLGSTYGFSMLFAALQCPIEIYYFTPNSVDGNATGFKHIFSPIFSTTDSITPLSEATSILNSIEDSINPLNLAGQILTKFVTIENYTGSSADIFNSEVDLTGCLVIRVLQPYDSSIPGSLNNGLLTATIDNIMFYQIDTTNLIPETVSYEESVKGWVSFKDFKDEKSRGIESGLSLSKKYYTFLGGAMWQHYTSNTYSLFYGDPKSAKITTIINDAPDVVKQFKALEYEGSDALFQDSEKWIHLQQDGFKTKNRDGWWCQNIKTNMAEGDVRYFFKKEDKWFNYIRGYSSINKSIKEGHLNVQGLGMVSSLVLISEE